MIIFEEQQAGRFSGVHAPDKDLLDDQLAILDDWPTGALRQTSLGLPEVSELQVVRHYTTLSRKNFSIDTHFYPLGSCTMKYNPRAVHRLASLPAFLRRHPLIPAQYDQGFLQCLYELQEILADVTGMKAVSLAPMAGAQGEFAGVKMIKAYHRARGDFDRDEIIVPDAAHGTNPASAVQCGFKVKEIKTGADGDIDLEGLKAVLGPRTAGIMLTNPSTLGVFERNIVEIAELVHEAGGLLYYDGANLNAIMGRARPGDMGFDVMHMNLHKTFATPHGGGGPGAGPIAVGERLEPFLPVPLIAEQSGKYFSLSEKERSQSIGRFSAFYGNSGILLRAYLYARLLGREGMRRVADFATLNANYLMHKLKEAGFTLAFPERLATHEFIVTMSPQLKSYQVSAMDIAKRLLDYGFHAPTTYFPLLVPECLLIEPTETEARSELDRFVAAMITILGEIEHEPALVQQAPHTLPVRRLDDVKAARELDLIWQPAAAED